MYLTQKTKKKKTKGEKELIIIKINLNSHVQFCWLQKKINSSENGHTA